MPCRGHLDDPHRGERVEDREAGGEEVDVEGRDVVQARAEPHVTRDDPPGEPGVGGRVQAGVGLQERVIPNCSTTRASGRIRPPAQAKRPPAVRRHVRPGQPAIFERTPLILLFCPFIPHFCRLIALYCVLTPSISGSRMPHSFVRGMVYRVRGRFALARPPGRASSGQFVVIGIVVFRERRR